MTDAAWWQDWIDFALANIWVVYVLGAVISTMTVFQAVKYVVRGALVGLNHFQRTVTVRIVGGVLSFFIGQYLLREVFDDKTATILSAFIALTQIYMFAYLVDWAVKHDARWLLRALKLRRVSGDGSADKFVDEHDVTVADFVEKRKSPR